MQELTVAREMTGFYWSQLLDWFMRAINFVCHWLRGDGKFHTDCSKAGFHISNFDGFTGGSIKLFDAR